MTRNELKEIIKESILEESLILNESILGVLGVLGAIIFGPYIVVLAIMIVAYPFCKIAKVKDEKWLKDFYNKNPKFIDATRELASSVNKVIAKEMGNDAKYLISNDILKSNISIRNKGNSDPYISVFISKLNGSLLLKDKTGYDSLYKYQDSIGFYNPDYTADCPKEVQEVINKYNNSIKNVEKYFKTISNSMVLNIYGIEESEFILGNLLAWDNGNKCAIDEQISCELGIKFSDFSKIKLPKATKVAVEKYLRKNGAELHESYLVDDSVNHIEESSIMNEGFWNQLSMGIKIKPHQTLDVTLKKHSYEGFLNLIRSTKKVEDLKYLRNDVHICINTIKTISARIDKCNKLGECKETASYYKGIKKMYIDKGITAEDCNKTILWFKEVCIKEINQKIKSL